MIRWILAAIAIIYTAAMIYAGPTHQGLPTRTARRIRAGILAARTGQGMPHDRLSGTAWCHTVLTTYRPRTRATADAPTYDALFSTHPLPRTHGG